MMTEKRAGAGARRRGGATAWTSAETRRARSAVPRQRPQSLRRRRGRGEGGFVVGVGHGGERPGPPAAAADAAARRDSSTAREVTTSSFYFIFYIIFYMVFKNAGEERFYSTGWRLEGGDEGTSVNAP